MNKTNIVPPISGAEATIGKVGAGITGALGVLGAFTSNAQTNSTSAIEQQIQQKANSQAMYGDNSSLLQAWGQPQLQYVSSRDIRQGVLPQIGNSISGVTQGAMAGAQLGGVAGGIIGGLAGLAGSIAGIITGNRKSRRIANRLNNQIKNVNNATYQGLVSNANMIETDTDNMLANTLAEGGYAYNTERLKNWIKGREGFVPHVYDDRGGAKSRYKPNKPISPNSVPTIGYGFTDKALISSYLNSGRTMTQEEADKRLDVELDKRMAEVFRLKGFHSMPKSVQDAVMYLNYGLGNGGLRRTDVVKAMARGDVQGVIHSIRTLKNGTSDPKIAKGIQRAWQETALFAEGKLDGKPTQQINKEVYGGIPQGTSPLGPTVQLGGDNTTMPSPFVNPFTGISVFGDPTPIVPHTDPFSLTSIYKKAYE